MINNYINKGILIFFMCLTIVEVGAQELGKVWSNAVGAEERAVIESKGFAPVSYTHLTLPTICSV